MAKIIGELFPPRTLLFREDVGTAEQSGQTYELTTSMGVGSPIVRNTKTGNWFVLGWADIVDLAKKAGIDEPFPTP